MSTHGPIEEEQRRRMNELAHFLDQHFNGPRQPGVAREWGFVLLTFRFGDAEGGRVNYISNGEREDVRVALKELLARWEGMDYPAPRTKQ